MFLAESCCPAHVACGIPRLGSACGKRGCFSRSGSDSDAVPMLNGMSVKIPGGSATYTDALYATLCVTVAELYRRTDGQYE